MKRDRQFRIGPARLSHSPSQGNVLELDIENRSDRDERLIVKASAGDPLKTDSAILFGRVSGTGSFAEAEVVVKARGTAQARIPYTIPSFAVPKPAAGL